jgi:GT2 family glycosyltransferase
MTGDLFDQLGALDAKHFGRRGWGAMEDYVLRLRAMGGAAYVTRRAYLTHAHGSTARAVWASYERYAHSEMRRGMRSKYGPHWRAQLEPTDQTPDSVRTRMIDLLRGSVDRLGLSETAIGRRA